MVFGGALLLVSWAVLLLMVLRRLPPSVLLSLLAYGASVAGLGLGVFGAAQYVGKSRGH
jgi:hypothetical protein